MEVKRIVSVVAFLVLFLTALFLFIREYPSDREFSVVFIVAGGVLLWGAYTNESLLSDSSQEHRDPVLIPSC